MRPFALVVAAVVTIAPVGAMAQAPRADRYELKPADGGFLRLDRESGATAFCRATGEGYDCRAAGEAAAETDIARLEKRIAALEEQVRTLGAGPLPEAAAPKPGEPKLIDPKAAETETAPTLRLPTDKEIDHLADVMGKALRRFKDFADALEKQVPPPDEQRL